MRGLKGFRELFEQGTPEERKEFVRAFVEQLVVDPDAGKGTLFIREFPALGLFRAGNSSFEMVAGARFEPATSGSRTRRATGTLCRQPDGKKLSEAARSGQSGVGLSTSNNASPLVD